jgi:CHAT domain-containing protein
MIKWILRGLFPLACLFYGSAWGCPDLPVHTVLEKGSRIELEALARQLADCPEKEDSLGMVFHKLGANAFGQGEITEAVHLTKLAVTHQEAASGGAPSESLGRSYFNLGYFYQLREDYKSAVPCFRSAAEIQQKLGNRELYRACLLKLSEMYKLAGAYDRAERQLRLIVEDTREVEEALNQAKASLMLSNLYNEAGQYEASIRESARAVSFFSAKGGAKGDDYAGALLNSAVAHYHLKDYKAAASFARRAAAAYRSLSNLTYETRTRNLLGLIALRQQEWQAAKRYLEEALALSRQDKNPENIAASLDNLGEWALEQGKLNMALAYFTDAVQALFPSFTFAAGLSASQKQYLARTPYKVGLLVHIRNYLRVQQRLLGEDGQAVDSGALEGALRVGDYLIDQLRFNHRDASTKLFWREKAWPFYEIAVSLCKQADNVKEAFYYMEKSQSVLLLEALSYADAMQVVPDSLRRQERILRRAIGDVQGALSATGTSDSTSLLREFVLLEKKLDSLTHYLGQQYAVYQKQQDWSAPVALGEFQEQHLSEPSRTLVHYLYGENRVYALWANGQSVGLVDLGERAVLSRQIADFMKWFQSPSAIENTPEVFKAKAYALFQALWTPLDVPASGEVLLIPSGPLAYLPFEALLSAPYAGADLEGAPYLVRDYKINYAFSATLFDQLQHQPGNKNREALVLAPFVTKGSASQPQLPYSEGEVSAVSQYFSAKVLQDTQATRTAFLNHQDIPAVLHFSTHAYGGQAATQPYIALSDSALYLRDLYQRSIPAELVVLSACQTQTGTMVPGEGVLGLSRGFFYAGSRSVVASLWNLNDFSTSQISQWFYEQLAAGTTKGEALRQSKLRFLADERFPAYQKSPYYWAGLTYYGNAGPLAAPVTRLWLWIVGAILGTLFLILLWRR